MSERKPMVVTPSMRFWAIASASQALCHALDLLEPGPLHDSMHECYMAIGKAHHELYEAVKEADKAPCEGK